jgi:hypothetical protein
VYKIVFPQILFFIFLMPIHDSPLEVASQYPKDERLIGLLEMVGEEDIDVATGLPAAFPLSV